MSTISNLQQALNCAGRCDCCQQLQSQINDLKADIARIPQVDNNELIQSTRSALQPDIATAIAAAIAGLVSKFQPQITDAIEKAKNALSTANATDAFAKKTFGEFIGINAEIAEAKRIANEAKAQATGADTKAVNAMNKEADLEKGLAVQVRQIEAEVKAAKDAQIAAELELRKQELAAQRSEAALRLEAEQRAARDAETLRISQKTDAQILEAFKARQLELLKEQQARSTEIMRNFEDKVAATEAGVRAEVTRATGAEGGISNVVAEKAAKSEVDGVRKSISALSESVGSRISAVEGVANKALGAAGDAVSKALEAIGISKNAQTVAGEACCFKSK